jgi:hypothetical protein
MIALFRLGVLAVLDRAELVSQAGVKKFSPLFRFAEVICFKDEMVQFA